MPGQPVQLGVPGLTQAAGWTQRGGGMRRMTRRLGKLGYLSQGGMTSGWDIPRRCAQRLASARPMPCSPGAAQLPHSLL